MAIRALWTGVSAIAVLALGASAAVAASSVGAPAGASLHPVTVELADATHAPSGSLYVSLASPTASRYFSAVTDDAIVSGHLLTDPPAAFSLDTANVVSLGDVTVAHAIAPGAALEFAYGNTSMNPYDLRAGGYDGVFLSDAALSSPFASIANGGAYAGMRLNLGDNLNLRFGTAARDGLRLTAGTAISPVPAELLASAGNGVNAQTLSASLDWQFADWGGLAVTASQASERGTILGRAIAGPIAVSNGADTTALGVSARVGFGDGWVTTVAFDAGVTQLDLKPGWLMPGADSLTSQSYGVAVAKQGLFGDDMLGFSVSRPVQSNGITFGDSFGPRTRLPLSALAGGGAPETDMQMGYVTTFLDGALAVQANAGYQMNANGESGKGAVTGVARAAIKF